jgi:hypothetical protein
MNTATAHIALNRKQAHTDHHRPQLDQKPNLFTITVFIALLVSGATYAARSLSRDV